MIDPFGRRISYLRLSVTDRCDMRCVYCLSESVAFRPRAEMLTLEELERVAAAFLRLGVCKIRLTGGEPLLRRNLMVLVEALGRRLGHGLDELTMTTNGTQLPRFAEGLAAAGLRRVNVSLDSLDPERFQSITRRGRLDRVIEGVLAARAAGLGVRINAVALAGINEADLDPLVEWCGTHGCDLCFIEMMPVAGRIGTPLPLALVRARLERRWLLTDLPDESGGPARFVRVQATGRRIGFIAPMTHSFCGDCNRVRVSCTGTLYPCLGQEMAVDLRGPLRGGEADAALEAAIQAAISRKPATHLFASVADATAGRRMNLTGG